MEQRLPFAKSDNGSEVECITLNNGTLSCQIMLFGATLRSLYVPDRTGHPVDVVLGYESAQEYRIYDGYLGATVGRFANRISGACFTLDGCEYVLAANDGANHIHGGRIGFSHRVWNIESLLSDSVILTLTSPHMEEGYPGNLAVRITYTLRDDTLLIHYYAISDVDTICSLTNHSYFNLAGQGTGPILDHELAVFAQMYTPSNAQNLPTGEVFPVSGTPMDLRTSAPIGSRIFEPFRQLCQAGGFDHNYVVDGVPGILRPAAQARCARSGICMDVRTTMPGIQIYTANCLEQGRPGKGGSSYGPYCGFCMETQHFPDAPNHPSFPSAVLKGGQEYDHVTTFTFSTYD